MTELLDTEPPNNLLEALDKVKAWELGLLNNLSPEGLNDILKEARDRHLGVLASVGAEA